MDTRVDDVQVMRVEFGRPGTSALRRFLRISTVTVLALAATAAILLFVPRTYESTARLIVEAPSGTSAADTAALVASQVELIKSRDVMMRAIDTDNLRSAPEFSNAGFSPVGALMRLVGLGDKRSVDEIALSNLSDRLVVAREGASSVISVTARAGDPVLAASIANHLARNHVDGWAARQAADSAGAATRLQQEIESLRAKVSAADASVTSYKIEHGLSDTAPVSNLDQLTSTAAAIADAQRRREDAQGRADVIRGLLATGEPLNGVSELGNSAVMALLLQSRATLQAELTERQTTLLPNHPTIRALRAQIEQNELQVRAEAGKIADSLEAEAKQAAEREQSLRGERASQQATGTAVADEAAQLQSLEREAKAQRDLLDSYLAKYADLSTSSGAGSRQDIRIIGDAAPSLEPASPNYLLVMGGVGFAALALQVAAMLLGQAVAPQQEPARIVEVAATQPLDEMPSPPAGVDFVETEPNDFTEAEADELVEATAAEFEHASAVEIPETAAEVEPDTTAPLSRPTVVADDLAALSQDLMAQEQRIVLLAGVGRFGDTLAVVERVLEDVILEELSAVVIDAADRGTSEMPGLTDLAVGAADYGDVLQTVGDNLAEVPWGRLRELDQESARPMTLAEALADIYHLVVVDTGNIEVCDALAVFAGVDASVAIVASTETPQAMIAAARQQVTALGFASARVIRIAPMRAEVA